jgi:GNAT superfamily N-acetyltransferase
MDHAAVLADFTAQMRRDPVGWTGTRIEREEHLTRAVAEDGGSNMVLWSDLSEAGADAAIEAEVSRFGGSGHGWEWKYYSYDQPADLPERLRKAGFVPAEAEALMVAEIAELDLDTSSPDGVRLVKVSDEAGVAAVVRVHDEVFGGDHAAIGEHIQGALGLQPHPLEAVVAMAGDTAISSARVEFPERSDFAGLWGGGTLAAWRGRGVFRALVAYRGRLARERGYRYLQVDASPDSRPILRRLGFAELAMTTPFEYPASLWVAVVAGPFGGEDRHDGGVDPVVFPAQRVTQHALGHEADLLVHPAGARVEGVDLERDPVHAELLEAVADDHPRRLGAEPTVAARGAERGAEAAAVVASVPVVEHDFAREPAAGLVHDGQVKAVGLGVPAAVPVQETGFGLLVPLG